MDPASFSFCPSCGGRLLGRTLRAGEPERLVCEACGFVFYMDPKVAVGTIISTDDQRVVLVRRAIEPGYGLWVFPGGYVDRGESLQDAALREAREESGLEIRIDELVNVYSYGGMSPIVIVYAATMVGGELCTDEECLEARLFTPAEIPWDALAFRSTREGLEQYFKTVRPGVRSSPGRGAGG
jgi:ADP-ribose pyrophosphatase YjhB (NUDIX family)